MFRYRIITAGLIILLFLVVGWLGSGIVFMDAPFKETYNKSDLIRLHVIANSDSKEDQAVKLKVRDRIIKVTEPLLLKVENQADAEKILKNSLVLLKGEASKELEKNGQKLPVQVTFGKYEFPEKRYFFGVLPAGEYKGIRVILGAGKGHNWWCVLYPPLCLIDPSVNTSQNTVPLKPVKVEYRIAFLEYLMKNKGLKMDDFWKGWINFLKTL